MEQPIINRLKKKASAMLELPKEIVLDFPLISIIGDEEINIENYRNIIEYSNDCVRIATKSGILRILGKNMALRQITQENIRITGFITALEYIR